MDILGNRLNSVIERTHTRHTEIVPKRPQCTATKHTEAKVKHTHTYYVTRYEKTDHFEKSANFAFLALVDAEFNVELKNVKTKA